MFPWLAPTRSSVTKGAVVTPANASPWQAYFGLPRRIRLEFGEGGRCDLTGREDQVTVAVYRSRPYGVEYAGWQHPLSPHYLAPSKEWLPVHGQPGGVGWRDWLALTFGTADEKRRPARAVASFARRAASDAAGGCREVRLDAFGYDMDNAKARGWTNASQPVLVATDEAHASAVRDVASRLTEGASLAASLLMGGIKSALFQRYEDATGDFSAAKTELWAGTEPAFFAALRDVAASEAVTDAADDECRRFVRTIADEALAIFDRWCPTESSAPALVRRVVTARYNLSRALGGWTKSGEQLSWPAPHSRARRRPRRPPAPDPAVPARRSARDRHDRHTTRRDRRRRH